MKKIVGIILVFVAILSCIMCGCKTNDTQKKESTKTVTVTDHNGNKVELPENIERIAVCDVFPLPSVLSVLFNSASKIVAMAPASMTAAKSGLLSELYPEILNADTSAISGADVNTEELMKLDPQVVFYSASDLKIGEKLKKAGFNAVAISAEKWNFNAVETLNQWVDLLSRIFPESVNECVGKVKKYGEDSLELVNKRTEKLKDSERKKLFFLFQYSEDSIVTSGHNFFGQWWADAIGAVNAGNELKDAFSVNVTLEQIYSWNPDIILMTNFNTSSPDDIYKNTVGSFDWSGISAVENKRVYKMPLGMYRSYTAGVDTPVTLLWIAKTVYPNLFEDIDITEKTIEYYKNMFGVELNEKQAESIFAPVSDAGKVYL